VEKVHGGWVSKSKREVCYFMVKMCEGRSTIMKCKFKVNAYL